MKSIALFPLSTGVRRTALFAGVASALLTGGIPLIGSTPGLVMGRVVFLPAPIAFLVHLAFALIYGALFSLILWRSRDWWTALAAAATSALIYLFNLALFADLGAVVPGSESHVMLAHLTFGVVFTFCFKLAEIGDTESEKVGNHRDSQERV